MYEANKGHERSGRPGTEVVNRSVGVPISHHPPSSATVVCRTWMCKGPSALPTASNTLPYSPYSLRVPCYPQFRRLVRQPLHSICAPCTTFPVASSGNHPRRLRVLSQVSSVCRSLAEWRPSRSLERLEESGTAASAHSDLQISRHPYHMISPSTASHWLVRLHPFIPSSRVRVSIHRQAQPDPPH